MRVYSKGQNKWVAKLIRQRKNLKKQQFTAPGQSTMKKRKKIPGIAPTGIVKKEIKTTNISCPCRSLVRPVDGHYISPS